MHDICDSNAFQKAIIPFLREIELVPFKFWCALKETVRVKENLSLFGPSLMNL